MTKNEFVSRVAESSGLKKHDVTCVLDTATNTLTEIMRTGDSVNLSGFGIFTSKVRDAHQGRNPATGETVTIPAKRVAIFKPAKVLKDAVNT